MCKFLTDSSFSFNFDSSFSLGFSMQDSAELSRLSFLQTVKSCAHEKCRPINFTQ